MYISVFSDIYYRVCLRVNLLGISETYSVLKIAVPQIHLVLAYSVPRLIYG